MFINLMKNVISKIKTFPLIILPIISIGLVGAMLIHEIGHWTACTLLGSHSFITVTLVDSYATCIDGPPHTSQLIQHCRRWSFCCSFCRAAYRKDPEPASLHPTRITCRNHNTKHQYVGRRCFSMDVWRCCTCAHTRNWYNTDNLD